MIASTVSAPPDTIFYPETDGQPMSENTRQFQWIVMLADNLAALYHDLPDVFVCGNQNWYPVKGAPEICNAPDVYVVFGRPKGHRSSYRQWEEGGIPMTVVFEVLSPGNSVTEMADKLAFYDEHGVAEYYLYDPERNRLLGYVRTGQTLASVRPINDFVSPRLGIRFDLSGPELVVRYPDGRPFLKFEELAAARQLADQRVEHEKHRADQAEQRTARLAALTRKVLRQEATAEDLAELEQLLPAEPHS